MIKKMSEYDSSKQYSKFLFYSSFSMGLSMIISYILNDLYVTLYFLFLFLSSINHWRKPEYGIRRNIDLFMVYFGASIVILQCCLLKSEFNRFMVVSILFNCIIFFILEYILVYFNSNKWVILHMSIHLYSILMVLFILIN
jgi:hypothetical protein